MKKIFFSLVALAALASCSKSEVEFEESTEISFAPVAHNITKSVAGVNTDGSHKAAFPVGQDLYIFAVAQDQNADGTFKDTWSEYLDDAQFISSRLDNGVYEGSEPYYWPNVKPLKFAGYSEACNSASLNPTMNFTTNQLTIEGYIQSNTTTDEGTNDLMWFPCDGVPYTKASGTVPATMKHACSWITVKIIGDGVTGDNYKIHNLTINQFYHSGNATCGATAASWTTTGTRTDEVLFNNADGETFPKDKTGETANAPKVFEDVANNMVIIPQKPTSINVTYSYVPQTGVAPITEVVKDLDLKITADAADVKNLWESGKHYVYTITITATEILIDPTVAQWTDVPVTTTPAI
jgi:hypothetical protein